MLSPGSKKNGKVSPDTKAVSILIDFWVSQPYETQVAEETTEVKIPSDLCMGKGLNGLSEINLFSGVVGKHQSSGNAPNQ